MDGIEHIGLDRTKAIGEADSFPCNRCGELLGVPKYSGYHYCPGCGKEYLFSHPGGKVTISFNEEHPSAAEMPRSHSEEQSRNSAAESSPFQSLLPVINEERLRRGIIFTGWLFLSVSVSIAVIGSRGLIAPIVWLIVAGGWILFAYLVAKEVI